MVWNNWATAAECEFDEVLPQWYVVGVMTPLFTAVWVCMLVLYVRIWAVASQQARKIARSSICALTERRPAGGDRKSVQVRERERERPKKTPIANLQFRFNLAACPSHSRLLYAVLVALFYRCQPSNVQPSRTRFAHHLQGHVLAGHGQFWPESNDICMEKPGTSSGLQSYAARPASGSCIRPMDRR